MFDSLGAPFPHVRRLIDSDTLAHSIRVADLSVSIATQLDFDEVTLSALRVGGLLHDVGKGFVPREILNKPGRLSSGERHEVEQHALLGERILSELVPTLCPLVFDMVRHHHERLDGTGYPDRLRGDQLSLPVRVLALADVYDALMSNRPYRTALTHDKALCILQEEGDRGRLDLRLIDVLRSTVRPGRHSHAI